jgi:uncharacterized membrane protein
MEQRSFWGGFVAGAGAVTATWAALHYGRRGGDSQVIRLEKSIQIGRPLEDVFDAWSDYRSIPNHVSMVRQVRVFGNRTHWRVDIGGTPFEWDAEITQVIPYQSIGWKSIAGPKHSGRITFARIGDDTLVHVQMNYAPGNRFVRPMLASFAGEMEGFIEQALREFKATLEAGGATIRRDQNLATPTGNARAENPSAATGTYGPGPELISDNQNPRFGAPETPVEYTRPPDAKY